MHYLVIYVLYHFDIGWNIQLSVHIDVQIGWVWPSHVKPPSLFSAHALHFYSTKVYTRIYVGHNLAKFQICSKLCALRGNCASEIDKACTCQLCIAITNVCLHVKCIGTLYNNGCVLAEYCTVVFEFLNLM